MTEVPGYLESASAAVTLLADPAVASAWDTPSALSEFTVSGLAGHLARQIVVVPESLASDAPEGEPVAVLDHYARAPWIGASLDADINVMVRRSGEEMAACGAAELARRTEAVLAQLRGSLPGLPPDRLVRPPGGPWLLTLRDFLLTRLASRRHGSAAVLRALSRSERAPATIAAF